MKRRKSKLGRRVIIRDYRIIVVTMILTAIGLIAIADASAPMAVRNFDDKFYFVKQQLIWAGIGIVLMLVVSRINYKIWEKLALPIFLVALFFLTIVVIPGVGSSLLGAKRWIFIGPISIQPSEFIKLSLSLYLAKVAAHNKKYWSYIIPVGLVGMLIMLQPDLGTTMVIVLMSMSQIFVAGVEFIKLILTFIFGGVMSLLLVLSSTYRKARLMTFLDQARDPLGTDYHIRQILFSLGSGGLLGVGLGQSKQKYLFLPETATDSIFAIIAEEAGFLGATLLIILIFVYIYLILRVARNAPDNFSKIFCVGVIGWVGGQAFLNLASMVALVPLTGIPLPFISYGGSALTTALIATGIIVNINKHSQKQ